MSQTEKQMAEQEPLDYNQQTDSEPQENNQDTQQENKDKESQKFKDGQILTFVRVRFPGNARTFPFLVGRRKFRYGQKVVAMSDRGMAVGYINSFPYEVPFDKSMLPVRSISKVATDEDLEKQKEHYRKEKEYETICKEFIEKHKLDMELTHVEFTQFGKKVVFYFTAPARVDFRALVKDLVSKLKTRIELRQISVRDRAASVGGIGPCGLQLCCSYFLTKYGNVNIKMAKNQNLSLSPTRLNGVCGQLKCCIKYEDDVYSDKRKQLPKEGSFIETVNGDRGKVLRLHILYEQFEMITDQGRIRRYVRDQFDHKIKLPASRKFPDSFNHVTNETSTLIGEHDEDHSHL